MSEDDKGLRAELIDAIAQHPFIPNRDVAEALFDLSIWPVLERAIDAGQVLFARKPTGKPIDVAILGWMRATLTAIVGLRGMEHTVSRRQLLDSLYNFEASAREALADAERQNEALKPEQHFSKTA